MMKRLKHGFPALRNAVSAALPDTFAVIGQCCLVAAGACVTTALALLAAGVLLIWDAYLLAGGEK